MRYDWLVSLTLLFPTFGGPRLSIIHRKLGTVVLNET
jgi:hypothetical protein